MNLRKLNRKSYRPEKKVSGSRKKRTQRRNKAEGSNRVLLKEIQQRKMIKRTVVIIH